MDQLANNQRDFRTAVKRATMRWLPSLYVRSQLMRRPEEFEPELAWLDKFVPTNCACIDVGAHFGLYTRRFAQIAPSVHAFEPVAEMAELLRRTSSSNVFVHQFAVSDHNGQAFLSIPIRKNRMDYALASIKPIGDTGSTVAVRREVSLVRLDSIFDGPVGFVKVDVEGHELSVLEGSTAIIARSRPGFLVEAEERHRTGATRSVFEFFTRRGYSGFFILDDTLKSISDFDPRLLQDPSAITTTGARRTRPYVNNFFFLSS
jgi:FkbM family methyltransferase